MTVGRYITGTQLDEILSIINLKYGYDFSSYAPASLMRRVLHFMSIADVDNAYELKYNFTNDSQFFLLFLQSMVVSVTEMFRDHSFFTFLRENILPQLASYPLIRIWHAGCATGEEAYSMAILLQEQQLLSRTKIYATDINPANIAKARKGIFPLENIKTYIRNYQLAGGQQEFTDYYTARYGNAIINKNLRDSIVFSQHNLVADKAFNEFHLVCCRNVLIYFNTNLQNHVLKLLYSSLAPHGYLAIGSKESLLFKEINDKLEIVSPENKIYRRKV